MNLLLVLLLLGAIYLFLEAGLVFFAMIVGVALLMGFIYSSFSQRSEASAHYKASPPQAHAPGELYRPAFRHNNHDALQKFWMTVGMIFNFVGKGVYKFLRFGFQTPDNKH